MAEEFIRQESFHLSNVALVPGILEKRRTAALLASSDINHSFLLQRLAHCALGVQMPRWSGYSIEQAYD